MTTISHIYILKAFNSSCLWATHPHQMETNPESVYDMTQGYFPGCFTMITLYEPSTPARLYFMPSSVLFTVPSTRNHQHREAA